MKNWWLYTLLLVCIATIVLLSAELKNSTEAQRRLNRENFAQFGKILRLQKELEKIQEEQSNGK